MLQSRSQALKSPAGLKKSPPRGKGLGSGHRSILVRLGPLATIESNKVKRVELVRFLRWQSEAETVASNTARAVLMTMQLEAELSRISNALFRESDRNRAMALMRHVTIT